MWPIIGCWCLSKYALIRIPAQERTASVYSGLARPSGIISFAACSGRSTKTLPCNCKSAGSRQPVVPGANNLKIASEVSKIALIDVIANNSTLDRLTPILVTSKKKARSHEHYPRTLLSKKFSRLKYTPQENFLTWVNFSTFFMLFLFFESLSHNFVKKNLSGRCWGVLSGLIWEVSCCALGIIRKLRHD